MTNLEKLLIDYNDMIVELILEYLSEHQIDINDITDLNDIIEKIME